MARTTVVTVSCNTRELTSLLLWSLRRFDVDADVLVVDNGSTDGSVSMLQAEAEAGACTVHRNERNLGHGAALNQAMAALVGEGRRAWVLDSDCVVARAGALTMLPASDAVLVGERSWDRWHGRDRFELCSLVLDVDAVASLGVSFADDGDPAWPVLAAVEAAGLPLADVPFLEDGWVIHRGRSTLATLVASGDSTHPLHDWAVEHHEPHFGGIPGAPERHAELLAEFRADLASGR